MRKGDAMKYVFIMNPSSGQKNARTAFIKKAETAAKALQLDYELYLTKAPQDGGRFARALCMKNSERGERLRFYGCGGDGTLNELVNFTAGFPNVEIGMIPMGTGNDYIRNYGVVSDFLDLKGQFLGKSKYSDLIKYRAFYEDKHTEGYCANMVNIGFDCNVVDLAGKAKRWPLLKGSLAYLVSVAIMLIKKKGADLRIEYEDGRIVDGKILLSAVANGCFCGGGVKGVPYCRLDDGLMDVSVIHNVSRLFFISMFPSYAKGTHLDKKKIREGGIIKYSKERRLVITANSGHMRLCIDGEITTQQRIEFSMARDAFRFIVPANIG